MSGLVISAAGAEECSEGDSEDWFHNVLGLVFVFHSANTLSSKYFVCGIASRFFSASNVDVGAGTKLDRDGSKLDGDGTKLESEGAEGAFLGELGVRR